MMRLIFLMPIFLGVFLFGLGLYALITGQLSLIRGSIQGAVARLLGVLLIVSVVFGLPIYLRLLVGWSMNLGH
jgi:hypothetical protein